MKGLSLDIDKLDEMLKQGITDAGLQKKNKMLEYLSESGRISGEHE